MKLLLSLGTMSPPQVPHSRCVGVINEFIKPTMIQAVESELDLRENISGASDELEVLQNNQLKIYHSLGVLLLSSYDIKLH